MAEVMPAVQIHGKPMVFYPNSHRYKYAGEWVPSVSSILSKADKPALVPWAANQAVDYIISKGLEQVDPGGALTGKMVINMDELELARTAHTRTKEAAGDVGSELHDYAKNYMRGQIMKLPNDEKVIRVAAKFREWHAKSRFDGFQLERPIYSQRLGYAGTPDFWGKYGGELFVIDYKTSKGIYGNHWLQCMAYKLAIMEERSLPKLRRGILHISRESERVDFHDDTQRIEDSDREAWLALVAYAKAMRVVEKREREVWKAANGG